MLTCDLNWRDLFLMDLRGEFLSGGKRNGNHEDIRRPIIDLRIPPRKTRISGDERKDQAPINFSSADLFVIRSVEPRSCANCLSRNSPRTRVTVSREVPMSCAISSCVSAILIRMPSLVCSPESAHSSNRRANFSETECERPSERIISYAVWQF